MPAPSGNKPLTSSNSSRVRELGIVLPLPRHRWGLTSSLRTSGICFPERNAPVVDRKLAISGRLGENLSVRQGQEAARIASLNVLAAASNI